MAQKHEVVGLGKGRKTEKKLSSHKLRTESPKLSEMEQERLNKELFHAVAYGEKTDVKRLILSGADIEARDKGGWTPLMHAALGGHTEICKLLLDDGAKVDARNDHGETALMNAAAYGLSDVVKLLLDNGADIEARDKGGWTPLMRAAANGHIKTCILLIERGAKVPKVDETAMQFAAEKGRLKEMVELLKKAEEAKAKGKGG